jgi:hypothetical protein
MILYNITTETTTTLILKNSATGGSIGSVVVSNNSTEDATVSVYIDDDTTQYYFIKNIVIPTAVAFVLEDLMSFDDKLYSLKLDNTGTSPDLSVMIQ